MATKSCTAPARKPAESILIVSDNSTLCLYMLNVIRDIYPERQLRCQFRYTSCNMHPESMLAIGAKSVNMMDDECIDAIIRDYDLVLSLHCKQIFPERLVESVTCINFHPGFNPYNRGWYPQAFSIINGLPAGATIHVMDSRIDHGGIIAQTEVEVLSSDTSLDAYERVIDAEKCLIRNHLRSIIDGSFDVVPPSSDGNYNSIDDYRGMCELDLDDVATLRSHLNLLRATSHGSYRNAFFYDVSGAKVFVKVVLGRE